MTERLIPSTSHPLFFFSPVNHIFFSFPGHGYFGKASGGNSEVS